LLTLSIVVGAPHCCKCETRDCLFYTKNYIFFTTTTTIDDTWLFTTIIIMNARLNNLPTAGSIVLRERMMLPGETADEFVERLAYALAPQKASAVKDLLRSAAMIPSSAVCRFYNTGKETPSACYLFVFSKNYDADVKLEEMHTVTRMAIKGTGVGVGADNLRSGSVTIEGVLQNNFIDICTNLNQSINLSVTTRKSRLAMYLSLHNISAYMCLSLRQQNNMITPNVFYGLMIPDLFMRAAERDEMWYFFDGQTSLENNEDEDDAVSSLNDCYGVEYEKLYERMVERKMYVKCMRASVLLGEIVSCLTENGFPYIVFRDTVNKYNNQRALGVVQTLNLCAEVCQHATNSLERRNASLCTLMTLNVAAFCERQQCMWHLIEHDLRAVSIPLDVLPEKRDNDEILAHCLYTSYMCTFVLNYMLGDSERREIGVSPTGLFDAVCIKHGVEAAYANAMISYAALVSEYIYYGCVLASVVFNRMYRVECVNFKHSAFAKGQFQFDLRNITPTLANKWQMMREYVKGGMANSMLTAQAPTATTSLITNVTESIQFPLAGKITTKNSKSGRFADAPFYAAVSGLQNDVIVHKNVPVLDQIKVYANAAPYVDQSQSVIVNCSPENTKVFETIVHAFRHQLKTGIYYFSFTSPTQYINLGNGTAAAAASKFSSCSACTL
jgi:ribonucleotide reductase alpha subunit